MLFSVIDPALLIYQREHWNTRQPHVAERIKALTLHRSMIRRYDQQMAMSSELAAMVYQHFPWNSDYRTLGELHDLRQFILEELVRARYVDEAPETVEVSLLPRNLTCEHVDSDLIWRAWKKLLYACVEEEDASEFDSQVATWETPIHTSNSQSIMVTVKEGDGSADHYLPLVWDESTWASRLSSQDPWPDLEKCVELYFKSNPAMQCHPMARNHPIPFECTSHFWRSVEHFCAPQLRVLLVKAITKKVYGILDPKLHDEPLGGIRRFRVTTFWRVHYRQFSDRLVLDEFGEHNMGL